MLKPTQLRRLKREPLDGAANRVEAARRLAKVTQVVLAADTGLTQSYISRIESGRYGRLPIETTRTLALYFGCAIEDLFPAREAMAS